VEDEMVRHCWHSLPKVFLTTGADVREEQCCWCEKHRSYTVERKLLPVKGKHGPHRILLPSQGVAGGSIIYPVETIYLVETVSDPMSLPFEDEECSGRKRREKAERRTSA